ncbi:MAG: hypothetical protein BJ554DRAFT_2990, partial [Olpidium bornovanus]
AIFAPSLRFAHTRRFRFAFAAAAAPSPPFAAAASPPFAATALPPFAAASPPPLRRRSPPRHLRRERLRRAPPHHAAAAAAPCHLRRERLRRAPLHHAAAAAVARSRPPVSRCRTRRFALLPVCLALAEKLKLPCTPAQRAGALNLLVHHLDHRLQTHYVLEKDPAALWGTLKARFDNRRVILLRQAKHDWLNLRVMDFRSISEYDARLHEIVSTLRLCGEQVAESDMIERTLTSLPVGSAVLAEQYRQQGYASYHELATQLQLAERNRELLLATAEQRPAGWESNLTGVAAAPSATSAAADLTSMDPYDGSVPVRVSVVTHAPTLTRTGTLSR